MKVYIAGKITGEPLYKEMFDIAQHNAMRKGYKVMNPSVLGEGFEQDEYMHVCYAMIDVCDAVSLLPNWSDSKGARQEYSYAVSKCKTIIHL